LVGVIRPPLLPAEVEEPEHPLSAAAMSSRRIVIAVNLKFFLVVNIL
jgi:hypothetical protein